MSSKARPPVRPRRPTTAADAARRRRWAAFCRGLLDHITRERRQARRAASSAERIIVDKRRALKLFTDWHVDEATDRAGARLYARRLWTRLKQEAADA